eukprot:scaffold138039_cov21-Tisochrysis_lutea.AAC.2
MVVAPADEGAAAAEAADVPPEQQQEGVLSRIWAVAPAHQGTAGCCHTAPAGLHAVWGHAGGIQELRCGSST